MPNAYEAMNDAELKAAIADLEKQADDLRALDLKLDMARGKPSPQQTALSRPMLDLLGSESDLSDEGVAADNCVTIRERDSMEQVRIPISELKSWLEEKLAY